MGVGVFQTIGYGIAGYSYFKQLILWNLRWFAFQLTGSADRSVSKVRHDGTYKPTPHFANQTFNTELPRCIFSWQVDWIIYIEWKPWSVHSALASKWSVLLLSRWSAWGAIKKTDSFASIQLDDFGLCNHLINYPQFASLVTILHRQGWRSRNRRQGGATASHHSGHPKSGNPNRG